MRIFAGVPREGRQFVKTVMVVAWVRQIVTLINGQYNVTCHAHSRLLASFRRSCVCGRYKETGVYVVT